MEVAPVFDDSTDLLSCEKVRFSANLAGRMREVTAFSAEVCADNARDRPGQRGSHPPGREGKGLGPARV